MIIITVAADIKEMRNCDLHIKDPDSYPAVSPGLKFALSCLKVTTCKACTERVGHRYPFNEIWGVRPRILIFIHAEFFHPNSYSKPVIVVSCSGNRFPPLLTPGSSYLEQ